MPSASWLTRDKVTCEYACLVNIQYTPIDISNTGHSLAAFDVWKHCHLIYGLSGGVRIWIRKKALRETQTLRALAVVRRRQKFPPRRKPLPGGGAGRPKFNQLWDCHYLNLQTQFGEDRCTQFRVIVVRDPQTNKPTNKHTRNRQDRLQYTAPLSLARSVTRCYSEKLR